MNFTLLRNKSTPIKQQESYLFFDHEFYKNTYNDLAEHGIVTKKQCLTHYLTCGKKEGRACCENEMILNHNTQLKQALEQNSLFPRCLPNKLHVLMRTSNRPEYFKRAIESILQQTYLNYDVTICYDKIESLSYLEPYENHEKIQYFHVEETCEDKYKFNLYCNQLMKKINDGYILFLDDDDIYLGNRCFEIINYHIGNYHMIIWKFLRPDKLVYPSNEHILSLGEIDTSMVCFHHSLQEKSSWGSKQYGDYYFYKPLFEDKTIKKQFVNFVLTTTQFNNKIGNYGENENKEINETN
jgi:hypothetical protein